MASSSSSSSDTLFSSNLISPAVASALPESYTIRPLARNDFGAGFLDVLRVLTTVGEVSEAEFQQRFDEMKGAGVGGGYHVLVILDGEGKIVGTGALIVERKFIHRLGLVGHIEDIAVAKDQQGKKLGLRIIQALDFVAENTGCYKVGPPPCLAGLACGGSGRGGERVDHLHMLHAACFGLPFHERS